MENFVRCMRPTVMVCAAHRNNRPHVMRNLWNFRTFRGDVDIDLCTKPKYVRCISSFTNKYRIIATLYVFNEQVHEKQLQHLPLNPFADLLAHLLIRTAPKCCIRGIAIVAVFATHVSSAFLVNTTKTEIN